MSGASLPRVSDMWGVSGDDEEGEEDDAGEGEGEDEYDAGGDARGGGRREAAAVQDELSEEDAARGVLITEVDAGVERSGDVGGAGGGVRVGPAGCSPRHWMLYNIGSTISSACT